MPRVEHCLAFAKLDISELWTYIVLMVTHRSVIIYSRTAPFIERSVRNLFAEEDLIFPDNIR
jgi:hypothetical protein